jgi:hypothetical protein
MLITHLPLLALDRAPCQNHQTTRIHQMMSKTTISSLKTIHLIPSLPFRYNLETYRIWPFSLRSSVNYLYISLSVKVIDLLSWKKLFEVDNKISCFGFLSQLDPDDYFAPSLSVIRRKMDGLRDSLVTSSAWRPNFKKPLETYPRLRVIQLKFSTPGCQACHLGGRKSSRLARLSGQPYNRVTFEVSLLIVLPKCHV